MEQENEFEKSYNNDAFGNANNAEETNSGQQSSDNLIAGGSSGLEYDYTKAPKTTKGPDRINLDGKTVVIDEAKVILPKPESEWDWSKQKTVKYKPCMFILYYDEGGQREYYSGMKVFERKQDGVSKYSEPVIQNNAKTQASVLKTKYAEFKNKKPEEISMHEFLSFLNSKPKALLKWVEFEYEGKITHKNIVEKFVA